MSKRTDVVYGTKEVKVASSWIGYDVGHVKPGYWVNFRHPGEDQVRMARAICTVSTTATADPHIKDWLVAAEMSPCGDNVFERWINPEWVIRSTPFPPARVLEFMFSDFSNRDDVIKHIDNGFPTGFNMYLVDEPPKRDPRWHPARLVKEGERHVFNESPSEIKARIVVETSYDGDEITSEVNFEGLGYARANPGPICRSVFNLQEAGLREVLKRMGWTPPPEAE